MKSVLPITAVVVVSLLIRVYGPDLIKSLILKDVNGGVHIPVTQPYQVPVAHTPVMPFGAGPAFADVQEKLNATTTTPTPAPTPVPRQTIRPAPPVHPAERLLGETTVREVP